jgi:DNA-binding CsgD family transcriptional regulator
MRDVELPPARGAFFALQCALSHHLGVTGDAAESIESPFEPLPLFRTLGALHRSLLLFRAGHLDEAVALYEGAGPVAAWSPPPFHALHTYAGGALAAAALGRAEDLAAVLELLQPFRGEHVVAEGVAYMGPVELALGRAALALGRLDEAIEDLSAAAVLAQRAGAHGFVAEARYFEASARATRDGPGDREQAAWSAKDAHRRADTLGMTAYVEPSRALVARLGTRPGGALSAREAEVAALVAEGLTNRQIAERLVISERTAQNHVQHILAKLRFTRRSQIAAWSAASR